jgi:hypothetical protein
MASQLKAMREYPSWIFYPQWMEIPPWVGPLVEVFSVNKDSIDSTTLHKLSDEVLSTIRLGLEKLGFLVEGGEKKNIVRPVYFGEYGRPGLQYQIDSYHENLKIALEVKNGPLDARKCSGY